MEHFFLQPGAAAQYRSPCVGMGLRRWEKDRRIKKKNASQEGSKEGRKEGGEGTSKPFRFNIVDVFCFAVLRFLLSVLDDASTAGVYGRTPWGEGSSTLVLWLCSI